MSNTPTDTDRKQATKGGFGRGQLECEPMFGQGEGDGGVSVPFISLPSDAATHEVSVHTSHGHTHTLALELAAMVA